MVRREGDLAGLPAMIADLIESNLNTDPGRKELLRGALKHVRITASDIDATVFMRIGAGELLVSDMSDEPADLWIWADAETLIELPNAKLMAGLPSVADPIGRAVTVKLLKGKMKIKGITKLGLLTRIQRLLSVSRT